MEWSLHDENGQFLQEVNCQYDAIDIANMFYEATEILIDLNRKIATIKARG